MNRVATHASVVLIRRKTRSLRQLPTVGRGGRGYEYVPMLCGTTMESRTHIVGECEIYKKERDALEKMKKLDVCNMEEFGTERSEKTIAILGDR